MTTDNYIFRGLQTTAIHAGEKPDLATRASSPSIVMSSSFVTDADTPFSAENLQEQTTFFYTREGTPTVQQLEQKLAVLLLCSQSQYCLRSFLLIEESRQEILEILPKIWRLLRLFLSHLWF